MIEASLAELCERVAWQARAAYPATPPPDPEPAPEPPPPPAVPTLWTVDDLEKLVDRHEQDFPERSDEWRWVVFYLRGYADSHGRLPARFRALVDETFADLL